MLTQSGHARRLFLTRAFGWRWERAATVIAVVAMGIVSPTLVLATPAQAGTPTVVNDPGWMPNVDAQIGATQLWKEGATGSGVGVALIDTGIAPVNGLTSGNTFAGPDLSTTAGVDGMYGMDAYGHGTFLAGIIAGRDDTVVSGSPLAADPVTDRGVAPDASLVSVKVAGPDGSVDPSQVIAALDWVAAHHADPGVNIRVVNLSYGTQSTQAYASDPLAAAVERVWRAGVVVDVAAGNDGQQNALLNDPAIDPYVIAIGANGTFGSDGKRLFVTSFTNSGNVGRHVDLVAPGSSIVSLRDPGSFVDVFNPQGMLPVANSDRFFRGSGTSEATAVVSGVVALLLQKYPSLTPDMVKNILMASAAPLYGATAGMVGAGSVDAAAADSLAAAVVKAGGQVPSGTTGVPLRSLPDQGRAQTYLTSSGAGSLDATRAGATVEVNGAAVTGQNTVFGVAYDPSQIGPNAPWDLASWGGGTWTGRAWSGRAWSGRAWSGQAWSGDAWTGRAWSSDTWDGRAWSAATWSSDQWAGATWSSTDWSGRAWSGNNWGQPASQVSFNNPSGVAVDRAGTVWVADTGSNQVDAFNSSGVQVHIISTTGNGSGRNGGQLSSPTGLATDSTGNVYIADRGNNQVEKFSPTGDFLATFTVNGLLNKGAPMPLKSPFAVAVDRLSNVYVADTGDNRVVELSPTGSFIQAFTKSGLSSNGGAMRAPQGVAVDANLNVYVADTGNNRVEEYRNDGTLLASWTTNGNPSLSSTMMNAPTAVAVDASGALWVADTGNDQIEQFAAGSGPETYWTTIGAGQFGAPNALAIDTSGNVFIANQGTDQIEEAGVQGVLKATYGVSSVSPSYVSRPQGTAIDAAGNLWIADTGNSQVTISTGAGVYLTAITSDGEPNGSMKKPADIAVSPTGTLWVADTGNNRVEEFTPNGQFLQAITTNGMDPATAMSTSLNAPSGVAVDKDSNVYVADTGNNRVEKFSRTGTFLQAFTSNGIPSGSNSALSTPSGVAVDATGNVYIADTGYNRVEEYSAAGAFITAWDNSGTPANPVMKTPTGIELDNAGNLWVADTGNSQLDEINLATGAVTGWTNNMNGLGQGTMNQPMGVTVDPAGNVFVADTGNSQIDQFNDNAVVLSTIGANNGLSSPQASAVDTSGYLYVADTGHNRVAKYGPDGTFIMSFNLDGDGAGSNAFMNAPSGIAVDNHGNVYVADTGNNQVEEFTSLGTFIRAFSASGLPTGQRQTMNAPSGVAVDPAGTVWVADTGNNRVEQFSPTGNLVGALTASGLPAGQRQTMNKPSAVAVDQAGNVYVADTGNNRVEMFTAGTFVKAFATSGLPTGQRQTMNAPAGVAVDTHGSVFVADTGNNRVEQFTATGVTGIGQLNKPAGVAVDANGVLYVASTNSIVDIGGKTLAPTGPVI